MRAIVWTQSLALLALAALTLWLHTRYHPRKREAVVRTKDEMEAALNYTAEQYIKVVQEKDALHEALAKRGEPQ